MLSFPVGLYFECFKMFIKTLYCFYLTNSKHYVFMTNLKLFELETTNDKLKFQYFAYYSVRYN